MRRPIPFLALFAPLLLTSPSVLQTQLVDTGTLEIRDAGRVVGREEFSLERVGPPDGGAGFRLVTIASYRSPGKEIHATFSFGADSTVQTLVLERSDGTRERILATFGSRRVTVRTVGGGRESAHEYPSAAHYWVIADSVFGSYVLQPSVPGGPFEVFAPESGRRVQARLQAHGTERVVVDGSRRTLTHYTLTAGRTSYELWYDAAGHLMRAAAPSWGLTAERVQR